MALIKESQALLFVNNALAAVGNLPNDSNYSDVIKNLSFSIFHDLHKKEFLDALKQILNNNSYDAPLSEDLFDNWSTVQDCINYLIDQTRRLAV